MAWLDLKLSDAAQPVRRAGFIARIDRDTGLVLESADGRSRHALNRTAALLWQLADGTRTVARLADDVRAMHPEASISRQDVEDLLCELAGRELVAISPNPARSHAPPLVRIGFAGFDDDFPAVVNAFTATCTQRLVPLVVDPAREQADLLFISNCRSLDASMTARQATAFRVFVEAGGNFPPELTPNLVVGTSAPATDAESWLKADPLPWLGEDRESWPDGPQAKELLRHIIGSNEDNTKPEHTPRRTTQPKLTIGMAAYDDFDGVYFTLQALRLYHREVKDEVEFLVVDNHPRSPSGEAIARLASWMSNLRYIRCEEFNGTAVRDFVFRYANGTYVLCIDSHVLIEPGALRRLIDYLDAREGCADLLQGPLVLDDLAGVATHCDPVWRGGMFGTWGCDPRGLDRDAAPFDIPLQGLGLFCCRQDAWPGFHPAFRGFGGEEGYIHEKFRQAGGRTLCLPFLRWVHRFARPGGQQYPNLWDDRMRNYYLGCEELGLDTQPVDDHFLEHVGPRLVEHVRHAWNEEKNNPLRCFDAIYCVSPERDAARWEHASTQIDHLGIGKLVRRFESAVTPENHHLGRLLSHRAIIAYAAQCRFERVLVFDDDVVFCRDALHHLRLALDELPRHRWWTLSLGGRERGGPSPKAPGCRHLDQPERGPATAYAMAYHRDSYEVLLDALPSGPEAGAAWLAQHDSIDAFLGRLGNRLAMDPPIAESRDA